MPQRSSSGRRSSGIKARESVSRADSGQWRGAAPGSPEMMMRVDHGRCATNASCISVSQTLPDASTLGTPT